MDPPSCFVSTPLGGRCQSSLPPKAVNLRRARSTYAAPCRKAVVARVESTATTFDELVSGLWHRVSGGKERIVTTPVESFGSSEGQWRFVLSTTVVAKKGREADMAKTLAMLDKLGKEDGLLGRAVNQDPEDRACFLILEHFGSTDAMKRYQATEVYQAFIRRVQTLLEKPMGVYLCRERDGQMTSGLYPFGPGGEGGRDDMVWNR